MVTIPKSSPIKHVVHKVVVGPWGRVWIGWCEHCDWGTQCASKERVEYAAYQAHAGYREYVIASWDEVEPERKTDRPTYRPKSRREALR